MHYRIIVNTLRKPSDEVLLLKHRKSFSNRGIAAKIGEMHGREAPSPTMIDNSIPY